MKVLEFNNIFSDNEVQDYNLFIEKLRNLKIKGYTTKELLTLIQKKMR